jgi:hypothetical protein
VRATQKTQISVVKLAEFFSPSFMGDSQMTKKTAKIKWRLFTGSFVETVSATSQLQRI